jgi:nitroimidazol reductase NimA-like FMN-containing flavoprotein (pyridoxamine 5'-phosphate oxidase superfamily)
MPGYGLPKGSSGLLPWKWAEQRLKKSHNYWIATARPDGRPHLMIVWGMWMEGAFYFSTGRQSRKAKNLSKRSHCVISTDQADQAVIVEGVARETPEVELRRRFIRLCERKYKFNFSAFEKDILSLKEPIYAVRPRVVFGLDEKKSLNAATRWRFEA